MRKIYILLLSFLSLEPGIGYAQSISAGGGHSLFLCAGNTVMDCGSNYYGQLGDGTTAIQRNVPVPITTLTNVTAFSAGGRHSIFLLNDGTVWTCGDNTHGQLGDGTTNPRNTPGQIIGLTGIIAVSAGMYQSLFLKNDGTVWACGANYYGQLGDGTIGDKYTPVQVSSLTGIIAIAGTEHPGSINPSTVKGHSLFLKNDGTVWACGYNGSGELGDGTTVPKSTPVQVTGLSGIISIAAGVYYSLFLKNDGTVWACGDNTSGQLGNGTHSPQPTPNPFQISSLGGIIKIATGSGHSIFLKNDGTVWACGYNFEGEVGDGSTIQRNTPVQVSGLLDIEAIAGGDKHSVFLKKDGTVWACGYNNAGQLGDGTSIAKYTPVQVTNLCNMATVVKGNSIGDNIAFYPNPTSKIVTVEINSASTTEGFTIRVINSLGEIFYAEDLKNVSGPLTKQIDVSSFAEGLYFIELMPLRDYGHSKVFKLVIE